MSKRKLVIFNKTPEFTAQGNDRVEKLALTTQEAIDEVHARIDGLPAAKPSTTIISNPSSPTVAVPFSQKWYSGDVLLNPDVREVHIDAALTLLRFGQYGVRVSDTDTETGPTFILARYGGWGTHDFTPYSSGKTKLRYECNFIYANTDQSILFEFGTVNNAAHKFRIRANTDTHTTWTLDAYSSSIVTFPAPADGAHTLIVEFNADGINIGKDQFNVWVDGTLQTLTDTGTVGSMSGINDALFLMEGSQYQDMFVNPRVNPTEVFPGAIWFSRMFDDVTGDAATEPSWTHLKGHWDTRTLQQSEYVERMRASIMQGLPDPLPRPGFTGTLQPWLLSSDSNFAFSCENNGVRNQLYSSLFTRAYGFPGQFTVYCDSVTAVGDTVEVLIVTPNVIRIPNLADNSDDQQWSLFHSPHGFNQTDTNLRWIRTLASYLTPEIF